MPGDGLLQARALTALIAFGIGTKATVGACAAAGFYFQVFGMKITDILNVGRVYVCVCVSGAGWQVWPLTQNLNGLYLAGDSPSRHFFLNPVSRECALLSLLRR